MHGNVILHIRIILTEKNPGCFFYKIFNMKLQLQGYGVGKNLALYVSECWRRVCIVNPNCWFSIVSCRINVYNAQELPPDDTVVSENLQVQNCACSLAVVCCGAIT